MVLCVGAVSSGKTLLLKHLTEPDTTTRDTVTLPTVGVNMYQLERKTKGARRKTQTVDIRELGGELSPLWTNYVKNENNLIFVIDSENLGQLALVCVKLAECLQQLEKNMMERRKLTRLLIVFTKVDRSGGEQILTIKRSLNLAEQLHYSKVIVEELNFNPVTRDGVDEIAAWIFKTKYAT